MANGNDLKFNSSLVRLITLIIVAVIGITASWASAREYTDVRVEKLRQEIVISINKMDEKLDFVSENVKVLIDRSNR